jgi:hypothetical protein
MAPLSTEDRLDLHDLYARYSYAFDGADPAAFAATFTADGAFRRDGYDDVTGTAALQAFVVEAARVTPGIKHLPSNVTFTATADGAAGRAYVLALRVTADGLLLRTFGGYEDALRRTPDGWRFAARRYAIWIATDLVDAPIHLGA